MKQRTLKEIVTGTMAEIQFICDGMVYYHIKVEDSLYHLTINSNDDEWKNTYIYPELKSITLMRWIRKGMKDGENFIQIR